MRAFFAWLSALLCCSFVSVVHAEVAPADRFVVVLKPRALPVEDWPSGTRAVVSELVARGYELVVRSSVATDLEALRRELEFAAREPATVGSVSIFRRDRTGTALAYTPRSGVVAVDADASEGTVSESSVALRVSELFRDHDIVATEKSAAVAANGENTASPRPSSIQASTDSVAPRAAPAAREHDSGALFFTAGLAVSDDLGGPVPMVGVGANSPRWGPLALDLVFSTSPGSAGVDTSAGEARLSLQALRSHVVFDPWFARAAGVSLALGAGAVWTQASATGEGDFTGKSDDTTVAILSARIAPFVRSGRFRFDLALEPGLMLPEVAINAAGKELAALGRPWTEISANFAWAL